MSNERILTRDEVSRILDKMWGEYAWKHEINWLNSTDGYLRQQIVDHHAVVEEKDKAYHELMEQAITFAEAFLDRMNKWGEWDDGCFYYNGRAASEFQELIRHYEAFLARPDVVAWRKQQEGTHGHD